MTRQSLCINQNKRLPPSTVGKQSPTGSWLQVVDGIFVQRKWYSFIQANSAHIRTHSWANRVGTGFHPLLDTLCSTQTAQLYMAA